MVCVSVLRWVALGNRYVLSVIIAIKTFLVVMDTSGEVEEAPSQLISRVIIPMRRRGGGER